VGTPRLTVLAFLAPALLALAAFRLLPAAHAILSSFQFDGAFAGLDNYSFLFSTPRIVNSIQTTLLFNLIINPLQIVIALALALLLVENVRWSSLWRIIIFAPATVPLSVTAIVWGIAFRPDDGIVNAILAAIGLPPQPFLTSPDQALFAIMILASWAGVGYWMVFLIAGLRDISPSYKEAAALDGAGYWRTLFYIILPMMRRPLAFVLVADTVANFLLFPPVQILTRGGPVNSTNVIMFEIYRNAFTFNDFGLAYALMVLLLILLVVIVSLQFRLLRSDV
jgi:multiple sugar transport system permease protein